MKKIIIAVSLAGITALAPLGIKNITDNVVNERSSELKNNGISLDILSSKGYLNTKRDFILTINDEIKFKAFIKRELLSKYPAYKNMIDDMFQKKSGEFDDFLKGIVFKGEITNSNINFNSDIQVNTYLDKFSDKIMNEIKKDEETNKIIMPFLEKQGLSFFMTYNNEGKLKYLKLKDIDENVKTKDKLKRDIESNIKILGYEIINKSTGEKVIADISLDKFFIELKGKENSKIVLENLEYTIDYLNELENGGVMSFEKFNFESKNIGLTLGTTLLEARGEAFTNSYSTNVSMSSNSFLVNNPKSDVKIDDFIIKMNADNLDYQSLKEVNNTYVKLETYNADPRLTKVQRAQAFETVGKPLLDALNKLINKGFMTDMNIDLKGFKNDKVSLESLVVDANAILNRNDINLKTLNNQVLLNYIDSHISISMLKTDMESLFKVIPPQVAMMVSMYAKEENDKVIFDIELEKGKISVNKKILN